MVPTNSAIQVRNLPCPLHNSSIQSRKNMKKFGVFATCRPFDYTYKDKMYTVKREPLITKFDAEQNVMDFKPKVKDPNRIRRPGPGTDKLKFPRKDEKLDGRRDIHKIFAKQ